MSKLRPTLGTSTNPTAPLDTALYLIQQSVLRRDGLLHGKLDDGQGHFCAIGCLFEDHRLVIETRLVDEVAAVNDSMPRVNMVTRRRRVLDWLNWKLAIVRSGQ